jgi:selenocysteine lyase/cysteine desulfurase
MIDIAKVRADTRGCEAVIHFNNAGSSLPPAPVVDAVIAHLKREEAMGGYEAAAAAAPQITAAYDSVARLINAKSDAIAFVEHATRAWDMAFYSLAFMPGDRILTARA